MADSITPAPPPNDGVVVTRTHLNRLWTMVTASLVLNLLILVLLLVGAIIHHHQEKMYAGRGAGGYGGGYFAQQGRFGWGPSYRQFGGPGWGPRGGYMGGPYFRTNGPNQGCMCMGAGGPGVSTSGGMNANAPGPVMIMRGSMGNTDPAKMSQGILDHLTSTLSLTDDQKAKIKPIVDQQVAEFQKQQEAQRQAMQKQLEDAKAKIKPLLTPEQQKQLDAIPLPGQKSDPSSSPPPPDQDTET